MPARRDHLPLPARLLVVMPTWLGDVVMATPTLRALRELFPTAHLAALVGENVQPMLAGCPWVDQIISVARSKGEQRPLRLARRLAAERFDMAVLLPNSFRTALTVALARIPRRVGYDRDGRGILLTDRLLPSRPAPVGDIRNETKPVRVIPTLDYYLAIAFYLGATTADPSMQLFTEPEEEEQAAKLLRRVGYKAEGGGPLVLLNPGSQRASKRWPAKRFAALADRCVERWQAQVALIGSPSEREVLDEVIRTAKARLLDLPATGLSLGTLKAVVRQSDLVVTNDSGPRHLAAAFGVPVVTLFGPTAPHWTEINYARERQVLAPGTAASRRAVDESPACRMERIEVATVLDAVQKALSRPRDGAGEVEAAKEFER